MRRLGSLAVPCAARYFAAAVPEAEITWAAFSGYTIKDVAAFDVWNAIGALELRARATGAGVRAGVNARLKRMVARGEKGPRCRR